MTDDLARAATDTSLRLQERFHRLSAEYDRVSSVGVMTKARQQRIHTLLKEMDRIERALARLDALHGPAKEPDQ